METQQYEVVIVGTGEGSKFLAWTLGKQGKRVAAIERKYIGGSCPNIACLPSKNVVHGAKVASYFRRSEEFGISEQGFKIDMSGVRDRKRMMVRDLVDIHVANFRASGVELIMGSAKFTGPKTLEVSLWRQSDNVPLEQSRNVPLTTPGWGDARRTATDDTGR